MVYEAIKPYIQIFDNQFKSFVEVCHKFKLINFDEIKITQEANEKLSKRSNTTENPAKKRKL